MHTDSHANSQRSFRNDNIEVPLGISLRISYCNYRKIPSIHSIGNSIGNYARYRAWRKEAAENPVFGALIF